MHCETMKDAQFIKEFENKVKNTIDDYHLIDENDKIIAACSGGKDSTTMLYLLNKFGKELGYNVEAMIIDLHIGEYSKTNLENIKKFCKDNKINLHVVSLREEFGYSVCYIRSVLKSKNIKLKDCAVCGILKRYLLNKKSRELGATKLATGHNLDDEAQSVLMNIIKGNPELGRSLGPTSIDMNDKARKNMENNGFVTRIRPLYFCSEKETEHYSRIMRFPVWYGICPCSAYAYRRSIKNVLDELEEKYPGTKRKIVENFLTILPMIRNCKRKKLQHCEECGEPSSNKVCSSCKLINMLKDKISPT